MQPTASVKARHQDTEVCLQETKPKSWSSKTAFLRDHRDHRKCPDAWWYCVASNLHQKTPVHPTHITIWEQCETAMTLHFIRCMHSKVLTVHNQAYSEYKHVLANILHSLFVARTPPVKTRSPDCRSNVENAPVDGQSPASQPRPLRIYGAQFWERPPSPASHRPAAHADPAQPAVRTMLSYRGMDASL